MDMWLLFLACAAIVGVIEYIKYLTPKWPKVVYHIVLLPLCVIAALTMPGKWYVKVLAFGVELLVVQVGYQLIIQGVIGLVRAAVEKARKG